MATVQRREQPLKSHVPANIAPGNAFSIRVTPARGECPALYISGTSVQRKGMYQVMAIAMVAFGK